MRSHKATMIERETIGLDFEALRHAIEGRKPDLVLGFYSEDAEVRVVNADAPLSPPFEFRGKAEISKYLRAVFEQAPRRDPGNGYDDARAHRGCDLSPG